MRGAVVVASAVAACTLGIGATTALAASAVGSLGVSASATATAGSGAPGSPAGVPAVPAAWEALDQAAATTCPGLPWAVLAAIGDVESDSGRSTAPGVGSGANAAGAEGPMQFEPATFAAFAVVGPGGADPPSPYDPVDAVYTGAAMLCADGGGSATGLAGAVWDYNHSTGYVATVLVLARSLAAAPALGAVPAMAITFAVSQLGVPYVWGGTGPSGYDCSGLVQAAYRAAGVALPRVAQTQFDAGPAVAPTTPPLPGDLLFFGSSATDVSHVGISIGDGDMIDAPHTGTVVRVDVAPTVPGSSWGGEVYVGATRPAGLGSG